MFDLYQALIPAISITTFFNILSLKLALRDNVTMAKIYEKKQTNHLADKQNQEESAAKRLAKYMLLHFTPVEFFAVRRARYKLAFFLAMSITLLVTYFVQTPFMLAGTGTAVYLLYFFVAMATFKPEDSEDKQGESKIYKQKYLQIIFSIISIVLNLMAVGLVFKNYKNSLISSFITDSCINIAIDNFLVRPIVVTLISLPLSRSQSALRYIKQCQKQLNFIQLYEQLGQKQMFSRPATSLSSGQKPKISLDLQIQPVPITNQNERQKLAEILKSIKKDKKLFPVNPVKNHQCELTLNSLFNSAKKQNDFQAQIPEIPLQQQRFQAKTGPEEFQLPVKKKLCSQNLIMISASKQQHAQNQQEIATEQALKGKINEESYMSVGRRETIEVNNNKQTINNEQQQNEPVKISIHSSSQPTSRQQPLRICLNGQINLDYQNNYHEEDDFEPDNYRKRREIHTIDQSGTKNTFGVLRIKEENHQHHISQIEEIHLSSPERRKRQIHVQLQQQAKMEVIKRKKKKFSHDNTQNRVIKFSTGEPYLQYLPHMLSKDSKGKKSQNINKKDIIADSRASNSVKKPKKRLIGLQNNQNAVPEFKIQEL